MFGIQNIKHCIILKGVCSPHPDGTQSDVGRRGEVVESSVSRLAGSWK